MRIHEVIGCRARRSVAESALAYRDHELLNRLDSVRSPSSAGVTVDGTWHVDRVMKGQSPTGPLSDVSAQLLVSRSEWSNGSPMKCVFAVTARAKDTRVLLSGGCVVDAE